ncbi:acetyl/propionyl/methylcrotonyl-CoA carboxylase subunit alpha [Acuticoccus sp. MNP-M23]|uniref:acetyl/propionyl/methylcrotonyl-CoA carboxylase subunit alpha n=1 Tax=Acuticoccus sp. MNP-M23 TaxID=3072793 RepID=UPI0028164148|nr:acetyl/propionyl/methylcrotonyl-CoA carboxylase subunit alpha [Acuticoccus sp. MNP-M23]WMS40869.1 acetyl/propionyl/methylcrotonyl-CoA carboxylase subunit alpha [Acuticoccus sp. MNP-M23]
MFAKILVANRGEIACRIMKTAQRMGIATVAVYSDADRHAPHVEMADEAVHIGPSPAADSYLKIDAILDACARTGAEAVHPGYGFLSERASFAKALADAGIVFIGPNADAIDAMGDKIESKLRAEAAGVSTVPGGKGALTSAEDALEVAETIGYPVMIKASAGGGGKGMRIAHSASEVKEGFDRARSEAAASFGDNRVFVEKFIVDPRHIEIQVLGDKHGNVIHLLERECSIQRRNQKVLEEAPSPLLDDETRAAMGAQAVALAKAVNYDSAGTVEFVASQDAEFYFLEMNTRLQVEHPVTELITGVDLVEQMIRVAYGERLSLEQDDISASGWAVESRLYAEDPDRNFMPSIGRLRRLAFPAERAGETTVRIDTGVVEGSEISRFYDPMIAKVITHGPTRDLAVEAMSEALDEVAIEGIRHNGTFLSALMAHPRWREGALSTAFIAQEFDGTGTAALGDDDRRTMAAVAFAAHARESQRRSGFGPHPSPAPAELSAVFADDVRIDAGLAGSWDTWRIMIDGMALDVVIESIEHAVWRGAVGGRRIIMGLDRRRGRSAMTWRGMRATARIASPRVADLMRHLPEESTAGSGKTVLCPMPGLVVSIDVAAGDNVEDGQQLAVIEAMKMENVLRAERSGKIKTVHVAPGASLAVDAPILEFE